MARAGSDDDSQLRLVVELVGDLRADQRLAVRGERGRAAQEDGGIVGDWVVPLLRVQRVVQPDADDLARARHGGQQRQAGQGPRLRARQLGRERLRGLGQVQRGEGGGRVRGQVRHHVGQGHHGVAQPGAQGRAAPILKRDQPHRTASPERLARRVCPKPPPVKRPRRTVRKPPETGARSRGHPRRFARPPGALPMPDEHAVTLQGHAPPTRSGAIPVSLTINGERRDAPGRALDDAARPAARAPRPDRHQEGLRPRPVRRLHRAGRRPAHQFLPDARRDAGRRRDHHHRGPGRGDGACTRCRRPSSSTTPSSAATARRARSARPSACSPKATPAPRDEIRELMSGNICRCGAYTNIVDADRGGDAARRGGRDEPLRLRPRRHASRRPSRRSRRRRRAGSSPAAPTSST